jgi:hypothetical protein
MLVQFKTALAVIFVASVPFHLVADTVRQSSEPLSAKEVRKAEAQAKTAADHLRLAAWYRSEASQTQLELTEEENLANYWGQKPEVVDRTKIPNPYWNARAWVRIYGEKLDRVTKLAANHERIGESLEANVKSTR